MKSSEYEGVPACIECGAIISADGRPCYQVTEHVALCNECALRRDGRYDSATKTWWRLPDLSGLDLT